VTSSSPVVATLSRLHSCCCCSAIRSNSSSNISPQQHRLLLFNNNNNNNNYQQQSSQFSAVVGQQLPHPLCRNYNDDDDQQNGKRDRNHSNTLYNKSLATINLNNITVIGNTNRSMSSMQQTTQNFNTSTTIFRQYHTTLPEQRGAAIVLTLGAVAATAKAGQYAVQGYKEWKVVMEEEERKKRQELEEKDNKKPMDDNTTKEEEEQQGEGKSDYTTGGSQSTTNNGDDGGAAAAAGNNTTDEVKRENFFAKFFNLSVGSKYYEGGFEEKMTRKEAALILGVRESSTTKRIKEAHRKLLILNHPDTGGSTYMAGKINEAKELLLKGKK